MPGKGGWYKSYDDELFDPKIEELTDSEYRVWRTCLSLCNRSPYRMRERGYLYHSKGFPVPAAYIGRRLAKSTEEVEAALIRLCEVGGSSSLLILEEGDGGPVYRIRAWRKRQDGTENDPGSTQEVPDTGDPGSTQEVPPIDVDVDVDPDIDKGPSGGSADEPPKSARAPKKERRGRRKREPMLTPEQTALKQVGIDHYWQRLQEKTNSPTPQWTSTGGDDGGIAAKFFAQKAQQAEMEFTADDFKGIVDVFFDDYIQPKSAANFDHFIKVWNSLLEEWAKPEAQARVEWRRNRRANAEKAAAAAADSRTSRYPNDPSPAASQGGEGGGKAGGEDGAGAAPGSSGGAPTQAPARDSEGDAVPSVREEDAPADQGVSEGAVSL